MDSSDDSQLTYYWYKFCDQPAIRVTHYTESELQEIPRRVELLHTNWSKDKAYLPSPRDPKAQLVELDPALLLTPLKGMEISYVPIAIEQKIK